MIWRELNWQVRSKIPTYLKLIPPIIFSEVLLKCGLRLDKKGKKSSCDMSHHRLSHEEEWGYIYVYNRTAVDHPTTCWAKSPNTIGGKWNDCFGVEQLSKIHALIFKLYWFLYTFFQPEDISNWVYWISYWITLILGRAEVKQSVRAGSIAKGRFVVLP